MRIAVFGGAGFLGSHVADVLSEAGHSVVIFDRARSPWLRPDQEMIEGDILDAASVADAVKGCEVVYNFAGIADISVCNAQIVESAHINIIGNLNVCEACVAHKVRRYVFASTMYVYSRAGGAYRCSKQACEAYIELYQSKKGLEYTVLRYGSLYGPRTDSGNGIHRFVQEAVTQSRIVYSGSADALREHIHVLDAAHASLEILDAKFANQHVILAGSQTMRMADLFRMISEILGKDVKKVFLNTGASGHYETTPYSYAPKIGIKYALSRHVDLGQGLLMKIEEIYHSLPDAGAPQKDHRGEKS